MKTRSVKQLAIIATSLMFISGHAFGEEKPTPPPIKDKTVKILMTYAFSLMPEVYTGPDGKKIDINKKQPKDVMIPIDDARRIIIVGNRSARAQNCDLKVMQTLNHNAMVKYEEVFKNWTTKQKLFINQLHLFTVLYMTGNIVVNQTEEDLKRAQGKKTEEDLRNKNPCSEEQRKNVAASIDNYLDAVKKAIGSELKRRNKLGSNEKKNNSIVGAVR